MAKYRRRRFRRRTGRWSSNIQKIHLTGAAPAAVEFGDVAVIAQNPGQSNSSVSQTYTVKNIEISGILEASSGSADIEEISYYIMYVPEGYPVNQALPFNHPEWIMAYKYIGQSYNSTSSNFTQPPRVKTRLARKLNTGDSIVFIYNGMNRSISDVSVKFNGLVRWWTKAN